MRPRVVLALAAVIALGIVAAVVAAPALAQDGPRRGPRGEHRGEFRALMQPVTDLLGMSPREIMEARRDGSSLADLAAARGIDQATLEQTILGAARTRLETGVAEGRLTRGQADALFQVAREFLPRIVTSTEMPRFGRMGDGPRPRFGEEGERRGPGPRSREGGDRPSPRGPQP
jgi:hypothetical protein